MNDPVNHPSHYQLFPDMEAIDVIRQSLSYIEYIGYLKGSALKYRLRAGDKGDTQQDIDKSNWYRARLREQIPDENSVGPGKPIQPDPFIPWSKEADLMKSWNDAIKFQSVKQMEVTPEEEEAWNAVDFGGMLNKTECNCHEFITDQTKCNQSLKP